MFKRCIIIITGIIIIIAVYFPTRHARRYSYIDMESIIDELDLRKPNVFEENLRNCSYQDVIFKNEDLTSITERKTFKSTRPGGEYKPAECIPLMRTAVIVPYRNRRQHLTLFLQYMHSFLQNHEIHYRIFVVEQNDTLPFNRAKMINYGAKLAIELMYDCLILHDVDLIPVNSGNIYGCTKMPRHMSSSLDTFRYNLPYLTLFGGAVAITSKQFQKVNGMSNTFHGWGGEDDDFYRRLVENNLEPCRFPPHISKYIMLPHEKEEANKDRFKILEDTKRTHRNDGLNSISNKFLVKMKNLYTHIIAS